MTRLEGIIIVLGSPNDDKGNLSEMGIARAKTALEQFILHPDYKVMPTGGFGEHFNKTKYPHALYLKNYLIKLGINDEAFLEIAESKYTADDAFKALEIIKNYQVKKIIVISSDFHMARVKYIFDTIFADFELSYIEAPYLNTCTKEEGERIVNHEKEAIDFLRTGKWLEHTEIS